MKNLFDKFREYLSDIESEQYSVRFDEGAADYACAEVSSRKESVFCELRISQRRLYVECDCGIESEGKFCEHLSRALQVAQEREVLLNALKKNVAAKILPMRAMESKIQEEEVSQESHFQEASYQASNFTSQSPIKPSQKSAGIAPRLCTTSDITVIFCLYQKRLEFFWKASGKGGYFDPRRAECNAHDLGLLDFFKELPLKNEGKVFYVEIEGLSSDQLLKIARAKQLYWRAEDRRLKKLDYVKGQWHLELQAMQSGEADFHLNVNLRNSQNEMMTYQQYIPGVYYNDGSILFYDVLGAQKILESWPRGFLKLEQKDVSDWIKDYLSPSQLVTDHLPEALRYTAKASTDVLGKLYFKTAEYRVKNREMLHVDLFWIYGEGEINDASADEEVIDVKNKEIFQRKLREEKFSKELLYALGFEYMNSGPEPGWKLLPAKLPEVVPALKERKWQTMAEGKSLRVPRDYSLQVSSSMEWLEIQGKVEFDGAGVSLPDILRQWMNGEQFIVLDDGSLGLLPEEWLKNFTALTELGEMSLEGLRFHRQQSLLVEKQLKEIEDQNCEFDYPTLSEKLESFKNLAPQEPQEGFKATLRDYQKQSLAWFIEMQKLGLGTCLADDMGLGKTVQVLAFLHHLAHQNELNKPILIVAPRSLLFNWEEEVKKFAPEFKVYQYLGPSRSKVLKVLKAGEILLTTYGTLMRDAVKLQGTVFDVCVADEAQAMKNPMSMTSKTMRLIQANFTIALTGTPVENSLGDLWSLMEFINPGLLGTYKHFSKIYLDPKCSQKNLEALRQTIHPLMLRRRKSEVAKELPPKTEQVLFCEMDGVQDKIYREIEAYYAQEKGKDEKKKEGDKPFNMLAALTRLRQAACHPCLVNEDYKEVESAKITVLMSQLQQVFESGSKALIFSQFTTFLDLIEERIQSAKWNYTRLDGSTKDRQVPVREFNDNPDCRFFLISLKAGGTGLNLTQAQYVYLMDPWWNPAAENQAIDRAYRIGQERAVSAYRLVAKGSIEDKMLALQAQKSQLVDDVIEAGAFQGKLNQDDLRALLK
ncbi:SNF2-related protein [Lentisphaera profundi]|uniref:SNF2-related protein n=1 Tax=Lentisphaera profundi TaxID=1658616 RepID=A0ABY7VRB5_9BACT|nr:DEAD/DEAH box helicase [Lentisphaera profundi]WDE95864.1 SNF2-related protein [Lentisphaera profundi]